MTSRLLCGIARPPSKVILRPNLLSVRCISMVTEFLGVKSKPMLGGEKLLNKVMPKLNVQSVIIC
ncbi:hypothetical protein D3C84_1092590 [compost metagenome]